jgi:hypothetical protein
MTRRKGKKKKFKGLSYNDEILQAVQTIIDRIGLSQRQGMDPQDSFEFVRRFLGKSDELDVAIAEELVRIPSEDTAKILMHMKTSCRSKASLRAVRKSLYRLRQRGISVEETEKGERDLPVIRPRSSSHPEGFVSAIDYLGNRLIILAVPRIPRGLSILQAVVSDVEGLLDFQRDEMTRKAFGAFLGDVREKARLPIVEIPAAYGRFLLEEAYALAEKRGKTPPQDYALAKRAISEIGAGVDGPLIYQFLDRDEIKGNDRLLVDSKDLLTAEVFVNWLLESEEVEPYVRAVTEAEASKIAVNPAQKEAWLQGIYQRALGELFPAERRLRYKRRLEEAAYVLVKLDRGDEAKRCLAAALDLEKEIGPLRPNPFLLQLVITSIYRAMAERQEKLEEEPPLIIRP